MSDSRDIVSLTVNCLHSLHSLRGVRGRVDAILRIKRRVSSAARRSTRYLAQTSPASLRAEECAAMQTDASEDVAAHHDVGEREGSWYQQQGQKRSAYSGE